MEKSAKFQMTIHIDYDREENKIQFLMDSQTKMIRTLVIKSGVFGAVFFKGFVFHEFRKMPYFHFGFLTLGKQFTTI